MRQLGAILGLTFALTFALAQSANADGIDRTYIVGTQPHAIAIDPTDGRVYVANTASTPGVVSVIDPASGLVSSLPTSETPSSLALDSIHRRLYVSSYGSTLDVFDLTTMAIVTTLPVYGVGVAVDTGSRRVYVAGGATGLTVIDGVTNAVIDTEPALTGQDWVSVALDPSLHRVYLANHTYDPYGYVPVYPSLVVLDDRDLSLVREQRLPVQPRWALAVDSARHRVHVAGAIWTDATGYVRKLITFDQALDQIGSVDLTADPLGLAVGADRMYVTLLAGYSVLDAQTLQVLDTFSTLPLRPFLPALDPQGQLYLGGQIIGAPYVVVAISPGNHAPVVSSTYFNPSEPITSDRLTFVVTAIDGDFAETPGGQRDPVTLSYEWARNGATIPGETGSTLDLSRSGVGDRGDTVTARVTVADPQGLTTSASSSVLIVNAPPVPTVTLSSTSPSTNDVLTATASAADADGDPVTFAYEWLRNGVVIVGATTSSLDLSTQGDEGDRIVVRVTASDDRGGFQVATASALVLPVAGSFMYLGSQPGDFVGRGLQQLFMPSNSSIQAWLPQGGDTFQADIMYGTQHWAAFISAPRGVPLAVGSYTGATRSAFRAAGIPGLDVYGNGRGCGTLTGRFNVTELAYSQFNELMLFDATFEQHCEGATPALFGRIRVEIPPPTPGVTLPAGSLTVPTSGNFLYLISRPTEFVGGGTEQLYTSANSKLYSDLPEGGDYFRASMQGGAHWWYVEIAAPPGQPLALGSYIRAVRAAFRPAGSPGLDVYGDGRQCSTANAKFDIEELTFAFGELVTFQATFQQPCGTGSLYGRIRIENPAPTGPGITLPAGAIAVPTTGSFLYLNSEPGEYVGSGLEQLFTAADSSVDGSMLTEVGDYFRGHMVQGNNTHYFYVDFAAPEGQPLAVGHYLRAARASFRPAGSPGLDVWGDGRGFNDLLGRFDVDELTFWPNGDVKVLQATFKLGGASPKLYGRYRLETQPPLQLGGTIREEGSVTSKSTTATIAGTVSCSRAATVDATVTLTQVQAKGVTVTSTLTVPVSCTAPSVSWSLPASPQSGGFKAGSATATISLGACELQRRCVSAGPITRTVKLNLGK